MGPLFGILGKAAMSRLASMPGKLGSAATAAQKLGNNLMAAGEFAMTLAKEIDQTAKQMIHLADAMGGRWVQIEDIAFKTARTMAMSREQAKQYNQELLSATRELAAQYGISAREIANFQKAYAEAVGRNVILTREQASHMAALSKITDSTTAQKLVDEFDKVGIGIKSSLAHIGHMQEKAKAFGVNASKASKSLASNIKLASSYSFRNGVADIEKMTLRSTALRVNMESIMRSTEKFANIEDAVKTSAELQVLGGSIGAFGANPMANMYNALANPAQYQEDVANMAKSLVTYDKKTGETNMAPVQAMIAKATADAIGMSREEFMNMAYAGVKNDAVMKQMGSKADEFTDEQKAAIQNLARGNFDPETGKYFITWLQDGKEHTKNVEDINADELKIAQDSQATEENMRMDVKDIKTILERVHGRARETQSTKEREKGLENWWDSIVAWGQNLYMRLVSNTYATATDATGTQHYASGGIVKPIAKAAVGTIVPGDSYMGDKTPVMANAGEMILNTRQQSDLFNFVRSTLYGRRIATSTYKNIGGIDGIKDYLTKFSDSINKNIGEVLKTHAFNFKQFVIKTGLKDKLDDIILNIKECFDLNKLKDVILENAKNRGKSYLDYLKKLYPSLVKGAAKMAEKAPKIMEKGKGLTKYVSDFVKGLIKPITSFSKNTYTKYAKPLIENIEDGIRPFSKYAKSVIDSISSYSKATINKISSFAKNLFNKILSIFGNFKNIFSGLYKKTDEMIKPLANKAKNIYKNAKDVAVKTLGGAKDLWNFVKGQGGKVWSETKNAYTKYAKSTINPIAKLVKGVAKKALNKANFIYEGIENYKDEKNINKNADAKISEVKKTPTSIEDKKKAISKIEKQRNKEIIDSRAHHISEAARWELAWKGIKTGLKSPGATISKLLGAIGLGAAGYWSGNIIEPLLKKVAHYSLDNDDEEDTKEVIMIDKNGNKVKLKLPAKPISLGVKDPIIESLHMFKHLQGKPQTTQEKPQQHANNGLIVPGNSYSGDKVPVMANSGEMILTKLQQSKLFTALNSINPIGPMLGSVTALPELGKFLKVLPSISPSSPTTNIGGKTDINLHVSGTIKLEGNGKSVDFDISKLLDTPEFKRQITDIVTRTWNENGNGGRYSKESSQNNTSIVFNRTGR